MILCVIFLTLIPLKREIFCWCGNMCNLHEAVYFLEIDGKMFYQRCKEIGMDIGDVMWKLSAPCECCWFYEVVDSFVKDTHISWIIHNAEFMSIKLENYECQQLALLEISINTIKL